MFPSHAFSVCGEILLKTVTVKQHHEVSAGQTVYSVLSL